MWRCLARVYSGVNGSDGFVWFENLVGTKVTVVKLVHGVHDVFLSKGSTGVTYLFFWNLFRGSAHSSSHFSCLDTLLVPTNGVGCLGARGGSFLFDHIFPILLFFSLQHVGKLVGLSGKGRFGSH